jgi:hypothetical protein
MVLVILSEEGQNKRSSHRFCFIHYNFLNGADNGMKFYFSIAHCHDDTHPPNKNEFIVKVKNDTDQRYSFLDSRRYSNDYQNTIIPFS